MKTYIFTTEYKRASYCSKAICKIYRVKNNVPYYVGECTFNTGSCKGNVSEVFTTLIDLKEIPESWKGNGYYYNSPGISKFKIIEL